MSARSQAIAILLNLRQQAFAAIGFESSLELSAEERAERRAHIDAWNKLRHAVGYLEAGR